MARPPFQTSTATAPAKGAAGLMADASEWNGLSGFITGTTKLRPGHPVARAGDRRFCALSDSLAAPAANFAGILRAHITAAPTGEFENDQMVAAVDEGHIWVTAGGACTAGGSVFFDPSANSGAGGYTNGPASTTVGKIPGAEYHTAATNAGDLVIVKLRKTPGLSVAYSA